MRGTRRLSARRAATGVVALAVAALFAPPAADATHPRPKAASPFHVSLVPAYGQCVAPDRTHGPPLGFPSCSSPAQSTHRVTVGNPPAAAANMVGYWHARIQPGVPGPPDDTGFPMRTSVTDVRCQAAGAGCGGAGADYAGELELRFVARLSDHWNGVAPGGGSDPATTEDFELGFPLVCVATSDPAIGSTCTADADLNFFYPGITKDTKRVVWELGQIRVLDGGDDGDTATSDDAEAFLTEGVFIL